MVEARNPYTVTVPEKAPVEFFALITTLAGRLPIVPADVTSIGFTLYDTTTRQMVLTGGSPWTLTVGTVVQAAVVTTDDGYPYADGYNFNYVLPSGLAQPGGRKLVAEFLFTYVATDDDDVPSAIARTASYRWNIIVSGRRGVT